jgi:serine phosphatase RsbU (regulator of sigma subunit)/anti-sigma regulatory factor (Ser/Thr protein kinase)
MQESTHSGQTFRLAATLDLLDPLRQQFLLFLKRMGVSHAEMDRWMFVFTEAVVNAIVHGSHNDPRASITVSWSAKKDEVMLEVEDSGSGPPHECTQRVELPRDAHAMQGRGLFMIHHFCDTVQHWRSEGKYRLVACCRHENVTSEQVNDLILDQALEEITLCYESLAAFYRLGDALIESKGMDAFFKQSMPDLERLVHADSIQFFASDRLHGSLLEAFEGVSFYVGTIDQAFQCARVAEDSMEYVWELPEEVSADPRFKQYGCGIMYPVKARRDVLGVLVITRYPGAPHFNAAELNTIRTFGDLTGIALAHADNAITREREQRAMQEVAIAVQLQDTLFPVPELRQASPREIFFAKRRSAREVGGDYLDACVTADGGRLFVVADVMGKGVSAAFFASMLRTALHIDLRKTDALLDHMTLLNQVLCSQVGDLTLFATCALVRVLGDFSKIEVVNAGHCPVLLLNEGQIKEIKPSGPPLGLFEDMSCVVESFDLKPDMGITLVTDGLFEWERNGVIWGWDAFLDFIKPEHFYRPQLLWERLQTLIKTGNEDRMDDQALLSWTWKK